MIIIDRFLTVNPYSRSGRQLSLCRAIILHYVGINAQRATTTWNFFERDCPLKKHYSSAHYIIDLNGDIYHAVPDNEVAYHCGSSKVDPATGKIYTDWARQKFGRHVLDPTKDSPNNCTLGIELCVDANGEFTAETVFAAVELVALLLTVHNLNTADIGHHQKVVGWKECPLPWVKKPEQFVLFKSKVREKLGLLI